MNKDLFNDEFIVRFYKMIYIKHSNNEKFYPPYLKKNSPDL